MIATKPRSLLRIYRLYTDSAGTTVRSERIYRSDGKIMHRSITTGPGRRELRSRWTVIGKFSPRALAWTREKKLRNGWAEE